ncbi:hypothetical protein BTVI_63993 [Pitangus sulphuratus]|nr:hypothetical protein BTVI_63993 [Pitangus sulphuratus]
MPSASKILVQYQRLGLGEAIELETNNPFEEQTEKCDTAMEETQQWMHATVPTLDTAWATARRESEVTVLLSRSTGRYSCLISEICFNLKANRLQLNCATEIRFNHPAFLSFHSFSSGLLGGIFKPFRNIQDLLA